MRFRQIILSIIILTTVSWTNNVFANKYFTLIEKNGKETVQIDFELFDRERPKTSDRERYAFIVHIAEAFRQEQLKCNKDFDGKILGNIFLDIENLTKDIIKTLCKHVGIDQESGDANSSASIPESCDFEQKSG